MESAPNRPTAEEIADMVAQRLVEGGGIPDLANANLMTIEEPTIQEVDRVTQIVMSELLAQQSREAEPVTACPKCGKTMTPKMAQHRSLQSRRGQSDDSPANSWSGRAAVIQGDVGRVQKQINERIKGTEKFRRDDSLEPLLQLKADDLSETPSGIVEASEATAFAIDAARPKPNLSNKPCHAPAATQS